MKKKYQIFISSTYDDLADARDQVIKTVLEMGHIPVGMEMFSAGDSAQWRIIESAISESDYYVVIVAHRYGSEIGGVSFTEKEYDCAIALGVPVVGFIIDAKAPWPGIHFEKNASKRKKLTSFKEKVMSRPVGFWSTPRDLYGKCSIALMKAFQDSHREGWIRLQKRVVAQTLEGESIEIDRTKAHEIDISFEYKITSDQREMEQSYQREIEGKIVGLEQGPDRSLFRYEVGSISAVAIKLGEALNDSVSSFSVFDESQEAMNLGGALWDFDENDFDEKLLERLGSPVCHEILLIRDINILPDFRGYFIGYGAIEDLRWNFCPSEGVLALNVSPSQFHPEYVKDHPELGLEKLTQSETMAKSKLAKYFERFGFIKHNRKTDLMLYSSVMKQPNIFELGYAGYFELPSK